MDPKVVIVTIYMSGLILDIMLLYIPSNNRYEKSCLFVCVDPVNLKRFKKWGYNML